MNRREPGIRRFLRSSRGTNLLETALLLPLLLLITFSIIEFGAMFYAYLALENGVSQATRYGITGAVSGSLSRQDSIKAAMRDATPTLTIADSAFTFNYLPQGGSAWLAGPGGPGDVEKVTVNYTWDFMTPLIRPFFTNGQFQMQVSSSMKNEGRFN
jgi:Flp pilus assembly protein TadG